MPSPYTPPDVVVSQVRRTVIANAELPQLPLVVVGPARQLVRRANAGVFTSGDAFQAALPDLAPGATVDPTSVQVLLEAVSDAGKQLGLFELAMPADAQLGAGDETIVVNDDIALAYSLLSSRNNNQPDSISDDDAGSGTPDGIFFSDDLVDFLSRGASVGDTDIVISAPTSNAGSYRIYALIGGGTAVNEVKVEKLSDVATGSKELNKTFNITGGGWANINGTAVINGADTNAANSDVGLVAPGGTVVTIPHANYPATGGFNVPDADSADQVVVQMPGGSPSNVTNAWNALVASAKVGDFLRVNNDDTVDANGDFKIIDVNTTAHTLTVIRVGQTGTGTATATGDAGGNASFNLLRVLRGRSDETNAAGDFVTMVVGGVTVEIEVEYATPKAIYLVSDVTGLTGATPVTVRRGVPYRGSVASYDLVKRLTSGFSGNVLVTYQAARGDLSLNGLMTIGGEEDIINQIGVIHPDNPLALGCDMVTRSGLTDGRRVFFALATDDNTLASYQKALDKLESEDVYYIVPLTQDKAVISLFKSHVDSQSLPENKHERVLIATTGIVEFEQVVPATGTTWPSDGEVNTGDNTIFESPSIDWNLVSPGDMVKVLSGTGAEATVIEERRVVSVDAANDRCTCLEEFTSTPGAALYFRVDTFPLTKSEQAEEWRDYANSLGDARVMLIRPDTVQITYTDTTGPVRQDVQIVVPSYYAAASFAGQCSSLPPQQPMTNMPISGIDRLFHSNSYFTPDQLNTIAEGGNNVLVQDTRTSAPYSRHQLTTDMTSLLTREFSIVKNVDFAAKFIRRSLRKYVGNKNITEEYLTQLRGITESLLRGLVRAESMLRRGTNLEALYQDADQPDSIVIKISLQVPYPANKIFVTLYV